MTAKEYNEKMAKLGWVVRYAFGKWVVCDGKAPDGITVNEGDSFVGHPLKWCDTMKQADTLCDLLNE
jgi:hypothetical protein